MVPDVTSAVQTRAPQALQAALATAVALKLFTVPLRDVLT